MSDRGPRGEPLTYLDGNMEELAVDREFELRLVNFEPTLDRC